MTNVNQFPKEERPRVLAGWLLGEMERSEVTFEELRLALLLNALQRVGDANSTLEAVRKTFPEPAR